MPKKESKINKIASKQQSMEKTQETLERQILKHEQEIKKLKEQYESLSDDRILRMLEEKNSTYSDKPRYTYSEIVAASGRSVGYISNLAAEHGLSRRKSIRSI